ncbi:MAG: APC family permease [Metamycoplasmataceae bacterium]
MQKKQVGYLSALLLITGSTIGSGIFLKNQSILTNAHGDLLFAILSWIISAIGIIAIGLSLIELSSASKKDQGILTWLKNFVGKKVSKFGSSYMLCVYYPLTLLCIPLYITLSMDNAAYSASGNHIFTNDWFAVLTAVGIFLWLLFISWISFSFAEKTQWIFTIIKFIPILVLPIFAYIFAGENSNSASPILPPTIEENGLIAVSKGIGIIASIPAILFAFDGFFTITTIRSNLKKKDNMSWIIFFGLLIIIFVYLYLSIAFSLPPNDGSSGGIKNVPKILAIILDSFIVISVLGILNGYCLSTNRVYEIAMDDKEFYLLSWMMKKNPNFGKRNNSFLFLLVSNIIIYLIVSIVTIYIWKPGNSNANHPNFYLHVYAMSDLLTNFTSLISFIFIGIAIGGCLYNRKKNFIEVKKSKIFIPSAVIAILFLSIGSIYFFIEPIVNIFLLKEWDGKMANIFSLLILFLSLFLSYINYRFEIYFDNKMNENYFPSNYKINSKL